MAEMRYDARADIASRPLTKDELLHIASSAPQMSTLSVFWGERGSLPADAIEWQGMVRRVNTSGGRRSLEMGWTVHPGQRTDADADPDAPLIAMWPQTAFDYFDVTVVTKGPDGMTSRKRYVGGRHTPVPSGTSSRVATPPPAPLSDAGSAASHHDPTSVEASVEVLALATQRKLKRVDTSIAELNARLASRDSHLEAIAAISSTLPAELARISRRLDDMDRRLRETSSVDAVGADAFAALAQRVAQLEDKVLEGFTRLHQQPPQQQQRPPEEQLGTRSVDEEDASVAASALGVAIGNGVKLHLSQTWPNDEFGVELILSRIEKTYRAKAGQLRQADNANRHVQQLLRQLSSRTEDFFRILGPAWPGNPRAHLVVNRILWALQATIEHHAGRHDFDLSMAKFDAKYPQALASSDLDLDAEFRMEVRDVPRPQAVGSSAVAKMERPRPTADDTPQRRQGIQPKSAVRHQGGAPAGGAQ